VVGGSAFVVCVEGGVQRWDCPHAAIKAQGTAHSSAHSTQHTAHAHRPVALHPEGVRIRNVGRLHVRHERQRPALVHAQPLLLRAARRHARDPLFRLHKRERARQAAAAVGLPGARLEAALAARLVVVLQAVALDAEELLVEAVDRDGEVHRGDQLGVRGGRGEGAGSGVPLLAGGGAVGADVL